MTTEKKVNQLEAGDVISHKPRYEDPMKLRILSGEPWGWRFSGDPIYQVEEVNPDYNKPGKVDRVKLPEDGTVEIVGN